MRAPLWSASLAAALVCAGCLSGGAEAGAEPVVTVRYEHFRSCSRFMDGEGEFLAYRIVSVENRGATPFTLDPERFRVPGGGASHVAPVFVVPEFSDLEVAPGATATSEETYLLERPSAGTPLEGAVQLGYDAPEVRMVRVGAEPVNDAAGCDGFNT